jgi:hypothetical protein
MVSCHDGVGGDLQIVGNASDPHPQPVLGLMSHYLKIGMLGEIEIEENANRVQWI